jgi:hypothetical protein
VWSCIVYHKLTTALVQGTAIVASVRATNAAGLSAVSSSASVRVRAAQPDFTHNPALTSTVTDGLILPGFSPSTTAVEVTWQATNDDAIEYRLRLVSDDGSEAPVFRELGEFSSDGAVLADLELHDGNRYTAQGETL